ncbi:MAG TPA: calcium/proton exchanger [Anaerolineae bacterium]|nr:calcium/proton exchanger [Anaerolineae bacterium]
MRGLRLLLLFIPIAILAELLHWSPLIVFGSSALAVVPLAALLGEATEAIAEKIGPRFGGLLNATLGNAAELIITLFAVRAGLLDLVKASIIGSILGNVLLVGGASILAGGLKHGLQRFNRSHAGLDSTLAILAVIALSIPSFFNAAIEPDQVRVEELSLTVAAAMLLIYVLSIVYTIRSRDKHEAATDTSIQPSHTAPRWTTRQSIGILIAATAAIVVMSEFLVSTVEPVSHALGLSEFFIGIIIVPIIGNVAEHVVAVQVALKNQMDLSLSIVMGSSLQIALFVAPVLVFVSLLMGHPLTLEFNSFELVSLIAASLISALVSLDGESNWLEGATLLIVYAIVALAFFFLPSV